MANNFILENAYMLLCSTPESTLKELHRNASKIKTFNKVNKKIDFLYDDLCFFKFERSDINIDKALNSLIDDNSKLVNALFSFYKETFFDNNLDELTHSYQKLKEEKNFAKINQIIPDNNFRLFINKTLMFLYANQYEKALNLYKSLLLGEKKSYFNEICNLLDLNKNNIKSANEIFNVIKSNILEYIDFSLSKNNYICDQKTITFVSKLENELSIDNTYSSKLQIKNKPQENKKVQEENSNIRRINVCINYFQYLIISQNVYRTDGFILKTKVCELISIIEENIIIFKSDKNLYKNVMHILLIINNQLISKHQDDILTYLKIFGLKDYDDIIRHISFNSSITAETIRIIDDFTKKHIDKTDVELNELYKNGSLYAIVESCKQNIRQRKLIKYFVWFIVIIVFFIIVH